MGTAGEEQTTGLHFCKGPAPFTWIGQIQMHRLLTIG
jgi:hypothetical protein